MPFARREFVHGRLAIADGKRGTQLLIMIALPDDFERAATHLRLNTVDGFVLFEVAILTGSRAAPQRRAEKDLDLPHDN